MRASPPGLAAGPGEWPLAGAAGASRRPGRAGRRPGREPAQTCVPPESLLLPLAACPPSSASFPLRWPRRSPLAPRAPIPCRASPLPEAKGHFRTPSAGLRGFQKQISSNQATPPRALGGLRVASVELRVPRQRRQPQASGRGARPLPARCAQL